MCISGILYCVNRHLILCKILSKYWVYTLIKHWILTVYCCKYQVKIVYIVLDCMCLALQISSEYWVYCPGPLNHKPPTKHLLPGAYQSYLALGLRFWASSTVRVSPPGWSVARLFSVRGGSARLWLWTSELNIYVNIGILANSFRHY